MDHWYYKRITNPNSLYPRKMTMSLFDPIRYVQEAEAIGIKRSHAEYHAQQLSRLVNDQLATKLDLAKLEASLKQDIKHIELVFDEKLKNFDEKLKNMGNVITVRMGGIMLAGMGILGFILKH